MVTVTLDNNPIWDSSSYATKKLRIYVNTEIPQNSVVRSVCRVKGRMLEIRSMVRSNEGNLCFCYIWYELT